MSPAGSSPGVATGGAAVRRGVGERARRVRPPARAAGHRARSASRSSRGRCSTSSLGRSRRPRRCSARSRSGRSTSDRSRSSACSSRSRSRSSGCSASAARRSKRPSGGPGSSARCGSRPRSRTCARSSSCTASSPRSGPASSRGCGCRRGSRSGMRAGAGTGRAILRWPVSRVGRVAALGAVAGLCAYGTWRGTTPLILVAGIALFIAGLDAIEPLAQEVDHPDRAQGVPVERGEMYVRHLAVPVVVMAIAGLIGLGAAAILDPAPGLFLVGAITIVPVAFAAAAAAAFAVVLGAPKVGSGLTMSFPEAATIGLILRQAFPPFLAALGGRAGHRGARGGAPARGPDRDRRARDGPRARHRRLRRRLPPHPEIGGLLMPVLVADDLTKEYGDVVALADFKLHGRAGRAHRARRPQRLGQVDVPAARRRPARADATACSSSANAPAGSMKARAEVSFVPDQPVLYDDLSVNEHIEFTAPAARRARLARARRRAARRCSGSTHRADDLPSRFSRGLRQKTSLVLGLVRPFSILLVDEPFVGLDPQRPGRADRAARRGRVGRRRGARRHPPARASSRTRRRCVALRDGHTEFEGPVDLARIQTLLG